MKLTIKNFVLAVLVIIGLVVTFPFIADLGRIALNLRLGRTS
jgi:hypothetical protein